MSQDPDLLARSHEVIIVINIVLTNLEEVKRVVSDLVIPISPDDPLELVHIKSISSQTVISQGVYHLLVQIVEQAEPHKVDILGPEYLDVLLGKTLDIDRHVLAVFLNPLRLDDLCLPQIVKEHGAAPEASCNYGHESVVVHPLAVGL